MKVIKCEVYNNKGKLFDMYLDEIPQKGTIIISQDGRYLDILSVRRKVKYDENMKGYVVDRVDVIVDDYGPDEW